MTSDDALAGLLTQLDGIANAPMTAPERNMRAQPRLDAAGLTPQQIAAATARGDLPWSAAKAREYGISLETWLQAVHIVNLPASGSVTELLDRLHRAEAAAGLLKAGYTPDSGPAGRLVWFGRA